jgi:N-acetylglucosaminylphosphatidylinositol deacetylase
VQVWCLVSTNAIRKFAGVLDAAPSVLSAYFSGGRTVCLLTPAAAAGRAAMRLHQTQWVWYRRLFVWLARYSYVNTLQLLRV